VIDLAKRELQWQPSIALKEGLEATIRDFRARLSQSTP
jgi:nucleoside-diphosphate-sugar epimerase